MVDPAPLKRRADFGSEDPVLISLRPCIPNGMEIRKRLRGLDHPNGRGEKPVHGFLEVVGGDRIPQIECGHLGQGVDSRIGAAAAGYMDIGPLDFFQDMMKRPLDSGDLRLDLPSVKIGAVVTDRDSDAPHRRKVAVRRARLAGPRKPTIPLDFKEQCGPTGTYIYKRRLAERY